MLDAATPDEAPAAEPEVTTETPVVAFFDVDNTLLRGASIYHLCRGAQKRGLLTKRDLLRFAWHQARFITVGENRHHLLGVQARALEIVRGHPESDLIAIADEVYEDFIAPKLWPATVELTRDHLRRGHEVWLITATPLVIAEVIAARLGLTGALGTRIESIDGIMTGNLNGPVLHGPQKVVAAIDLTARLGSDLAECWAYSDSRNDIPLLELVGHRVVVNADASLARHARKHGWDSLRLKASSLPRHSKKRRA